jgi:hypothetical protein
MQWMNQAYAWKLILHTSDLIPGGLGIDFGEPEVHDPQVPCPHDQLIVGLQITVDDPDIVDIGESSCQLFAVQLHLVLRQRGLRHEKLFEAARLVEGNEQAMSTDVVKSSKELNYVPVSLDFAEELGHPLDLAVPNNRRKTDISSIMSGT